MLDQEQKDKQFADLKEEKSDINLLPEDLRSLESKEVKDMHGDKNPELRSPKLSQTKENKAKLPWFSFRRFFSKPKKDKPVKEAEPAIKKTEQPKVVLEIINKRRDQKQQLEKAKEEIVKKEILSSVFKKDRPELPSHDHDLFNKRPTELKSSVEDMFSKTPAPIKNIEQADAGKNILQPRENFPKTNTDLPSVPAEPQSKIEQPVPAKPVEVPITPTPLSPAEGKKEIAEQKTRKFIHIPQNGKQEGNGLGVNLIPTSLTLRTWKQVIKSVIWIIILSVVFNVLAYGALYAWGQQIDNQTTEIDQKIKKVQASILNFEHLQDQISVLEDQITSVDWLLQRHIYWTKFFSLLEKYTLDDVYFQGFSAGINGNISLKANGPDITSAARQLKLLESEAAKELVSTVSVTRVTAAGEQGYTFTIDLQLNNNLFYFNDGQAQ